MTEPAEATQPAGGDQALSSADARPSGPMPEPVAIPPGLERLARWASERIVMLTAVALIAAQLIWKAELLRGLYFLWDDFHDLDLAIEHPLSWGYLTYIFDGHLIIGLRLVAWVLARISLYNWGLASAVTLAFTAAAGLACYRALRTLFGDGPKILIPLIFYLLTPLTITTFAWWSSAMESIPLQFAIFMALTSHVRYVRTGRTRHLVWAGVWVTFGLLFFEKALVLPLLLFVITAGFLVSRRGLLAGALTALRQFWRAWAMYAVLMISYSVILGVALRSSIAQPQSPPSTGAIATLTLGLFKNSFLPGVFGGPWLWYPTQYVVAGTPSFLAWLSVIAAVIVVAVSVAVRRVAWLAWATVAGWILAADVVPLALGRVSTILPSLLGLDIRYVADAAPVTAICIGLALWPVDGASAAAESRRPARASGKVQPKAAQQVGMVVAGLAGIFVFGSVVSVQKLGTTISGAAVRSYIGNATSAIGKAPAGQSVYDWPVPEIIAPSIFGRYAAVSTVVGDLAIGKLHWIHKVRGTIDNLGWFGTDGKLYQAWVGPTSSLERPAGQACWPQRRGQVVAKFSAASSIYTWIIRFGYRLGPGQSVTVTVRYGKSVGELTLLPGSHIAYLPVRGGGVTSVTFSGLGTTPLCVRDVEAGSIIASPFTKPIP